jgi:hypothetical protein
MDNLDHTPEGQLALQFVQHLADGRYDEAHRLLAPEFAHMVPPSELQQNYESMISYGKGPAVKVWDAAWIGPGDQETDFGLVYVSVCGEDWLEGVTVLITEAIDGLRIRDIVWGRP